MSRKLPNLLTWFLVCVLLSGISIGCANNQQIAMQVTSNQDLSEFNKRAAENGFSPSNRGIYKGHALYEYRKPGSFPVFLITDQSEKIVYFEAFDYGSSNVIRDARGLSDFVDGLNANRSKLDINLETNKSK